MFRSVFRDYGFVIILLFLLIAHSALAEQQANSAAGSLHGAKLDAKIAHRLSAAACTTTATTCGSTIQGALDNQDCPLSDGTFADNYTFQGTAGDQVTITMSAAFDTYLILINPAGQLETFDEDAGPGTDSRIVYTLTSTGTWTVVANSSHNPDVGPYTVSIHCGVPTCTPTATSMCLNDRFRVSATWQTATASGAGTPVLLTSDTGYFWFFASSNAEIVVKVLNGCGVNSHYWTFAGGLTDVLVNLTVTDTQTGAVKTYTNPQHQAFLPIQDTSSFSTCP